MCSFAGPAILLEELPIGHVEQAFRPLFEEGMLGSGRRAEPSRRAGPSPGRR
jgi:hypothetical protein